MLLIPKQADNFGPKTRWRTAKCEARQARKYICKWNARRPGWKCIKL